MMIASKRLAHNVEMQKMQAELLAVVDVSRAPPSCDPPAAAGRVAMRSCSLRDGQLASGFSRPSALMMPPGFLRNISRCVQQM